MSDNLIIFGANNRECGQHLSLNKDRYSSYRHFIFACDDSIIRGFNDVDILFLRNWWCRNSSREILDALEVYIFNYGSTVVGEVVGDKKYLPPYLVDKYINKFENKDNLYSRTNRFEILDLRGY